MVSTVGKISNRTVRTIPQIRGKYGNIGQVGTTKCRMVAYHDIARLELGHGFDDFSLGTYAQRAQMYWNMGALATRYPLPSSKAQEKSNRSNIYRECSAFQLSTHFLCQAKETVGKQFSSRNLWKSLFLLTRASKNSRSKLPIALSRTPTILDPKGAKNHPPPGRDPLPEHPPKYPRGTETAYSPMVLSALWNSKDSICSS